MAYNAGDISVVVPVGNGSPRIREVIARILAAAPPPGEVVVVNDRVTDASLADVPAAANLRVVANDGPPGPAAARNAGARAARGPIILFIDADVFVANDTFERLAAAYVEGTDGVIGVEAEVPTLANVASRYKNLWMRFTYLRLPARVALFYTSCASIKKEVFWAAGGFDEGYRRPSVEDTAFGRTLAAKGYVIALEKSIAVEHRKIYTTVGVLATAFRRGAALSRCIWRMGPGRGGNRTSVPTSFVIATALSILFPLWAVAAAFSRPLAAIGGAATLAAFYALNWRWLAFVAKRSVALAAAALVLLPLELALGFAGGAWGTGTYFLLGRRY